MLSQHPVKSIELKTNQCGLTSKDSLWLESSTRLRINRVGTYPITVSRFNPNTNRTTPLIGQFDRFVRTGHVFVFEKRISVIIFFRFFLAVIGDI